MTAAMFTITIMARSNELTPIKACGIPIYRAFVPFVVFATFIVSVMVLLQEKIIPDISYELEVLEHVKKARVKEIYGIQHRDEYGNFFYVKKYIPAKQKMESIRLIILHEGSLKPKKTVDAFEGTWFRRDGKSYIKLENGKIMSYNFEGVLESLPSSIPKTGFIVETSFRDRHITHPEKKNMDMLSSRELVSLIKRNPAFTEAKVTLYSRLFFPLCNVLLIFLGIPWMLRHHVQNFFIGAAICCIISGLFYATYLAFLNLGYKEILNPLFATGFPMILFGSLGISFMTIVHT